EGGCQAQGYRCFGAKQLMSRSFPRVLTFAIGSITAIATGPALASVQAGSAQKFDGINHIVVIYEENHSFDNLYGGWEGVNGLGGADAAHTAQVIQTDATTRYTCLKQNDVNLVSAQGPICTASKNGTTFTSRFITAPVDADTYT